MNPPCLRSREHRLSHAPSRCVAMPLAFPGIVLAASNDPVAKDRVREMERLMQPGSERGDSSVPDAAYYLVGLVLLLGVIVVLRRALIS